MVRHVPDEEQLIKLLLTRKFRAQGLRLTARRREFVDAVARAARTGGDPESIVLKSSKIVDLTLRAEDVDKLWPSIQQALSEAAAATMRDGARTAASEVIRTARATAKAQRTDQVRQRKRLLGPWAAALDWLRVVVGVCQETAFGAAERRPGRADGKATREALRALQSHGCLIAGEILTLLEGGFASGALARWRALHEVVVVADFISARGDEVAKRFLKHEAANEKRLRAAARFGLQPGEEVAPLDRRHARILRKHGPGFEQDYGWASTDLGKSKPTLSDLQTAESRGHWNLPYAIACGAVHPRAMTVLRPAGHAGGPGLLIGPSSADVHIAADWTVARLCHLTVECLCREPTFDDNVALVVISAVGKRAQREINRGWRQWCKRHDPAALTI